MAAGRGGHGGGGAVGAVRAGAGEAADRERDRRSGGERRPARDAGRDRRPGGRRQRVRRGGRRGRACSAWSSRTAAASAAAASWSSATAKTGEITTIDSREKSPAAMVPSSFFIDGKPPTDAQFPINRYSGLSRRRARHARRVGVRAAPLRHLLARARRSAYGVERRAPTASRSTRRSSTRRRRNAPYFDDIPSTRGDLPRRRRHAAATSAPSITQPGHGQDLRADRPLRRDQGLLQRPGRRRDRQGRARTVRRSAPTADHTWRPA